MQVIGICICRRVFTLDLSFPYSLVHSSGWSRAPWTSFGAGPCVPLGTGALMNLSGRCCGTVEACCQSHCGNHCHGHPPHYRDHQTLFVKTQAKCRDCHFQSVKRSLLFFLVTGLKKRCESQRHIRVFVKQSLSSFMLYKIFA